MLSENVIEIHDGNLSRYASNTAIVVAMKEGSEVNKFIASRLIPDFAHRFPQIRFLVATVESKSGNILNARIRSRFHVMQCPTIVAMIDGRSIARREGILASDLAESFQQLVNSILR